MALQKQSKIKIGHSYGGWKVEKDASAVTLKDDTWVCHDTYGNRTVFRAYELLALVNRNRRMPPRDGDHYAINKEQVSKIKQYCARAAISVDLFIFEAVKDKLLLTNPNPRKGWSAKEYMKK